SKKCMPTSTCRRRSFRRSRRNHAAAILPEKPPHYALMIIESPLGKDRKKMRFPEGEEHVEESKARCGGCRVGFVRRGVPIRSRSYESKRGRGGSGARGAGRTADRHRRGRRNRPAPCDGSRGRGRRRGDA